MAKQSLKWTILLGIQVAVLCGSALAQKGTVVDKATGKPIAKAYVMHRPSWAIAMTNDQGAFELPGGLVHLKGAQEQSPAQPPITFRGNGVLELDAGDGTPVLIDALGAAHRLFPLGANRFQAERIGNGVYTLLGPHGAYRLISLGGIWQSVSRVGAGLNRNPGGLAKSSALPESLVVSRYGYDPSVVVISSQEVGAISLSPNAKAAPPGMRALTGGAFKMGNNRQAAEAPVHEVTVSGFYIDTTEVTQADFEVLTGTTPWYRKQGSYSITFGHRQPGLGISWNEAALYCNLRSKRDGLDTVFSYSSLTKNRDNLVLLNDIKVDLSKNGYRIPTEAEWEYACKGGQDSIYFWGTNKDIEDSAKIYSWFNHNTNMTDSGLSSNPVAMKKPNQYKLYDMAGNAAEYALDSRVSPYPTTSSLNPYYQDSEIPPSRTGRSGSFIFRSDAMSCSSRGSLYAFNYSVNSGFRVVLPIR